MKKEFKEYRGFWYVENEEDWNISREEDDNGDAWYFSKDSFSLDGAIDRIILMDNFQNIVDNIITEFGPSGFKEFAEFIEHKIYSLKRNNEK